MTLKSVLIFKESFSVIVFWKSGFVVHGNFSWIFTKLTFEDLRNSLQREKDKVNK